MKHLEVDVAVIGAGSAGLRAFRKASEWTDKVVLIEGGPHGTTCARVGCMPSKLLIAAAESAHAVQQAPKFGVETDGVRIDGVAVMRRVRSERDRFVSFVVGGVEEIPAAKRLSGYAKFVDDHRLEVGGHTTVTADRVVIATGSTPVIPPFLQVLGDRLVVNDDVFDWQDLPRSVAVFGPGIIGLELGQALKRLGVDVIMFGRGGPVGPLTDPELLAVAADIFGNEYYLDADADVERVERTANGVRIKYVGHDGVVTSKDVDYVIAATGRQPNVSGLELNNTSLPLDAAGVPDFDPATLRVAETHVFIAGDVSNFRPVLHEAADEGTLAGINAGRFPDVQSRKRSSPLSIVFTDPQIAMVGTRYADIRPTKVVVGEVSFADQGRSRVMLKNEGLLRIYADIASGRFLGAEMLGPRAEHIGHLLAWSHQAGMTIAQMLKMPFYHPVIEEGLRTALRDAQAKLDNLRHQADVSVEISVA
ncbi:MAG: dihydrolipoyl dehydrogenase [Gammaproteobacteria bacterium]|nr:dihydrolipoyl dehydrogenase [Gammaproteobacteria bacterium]